MGMGEEKRVFIEPSESRFDLTKNITSGTVEALCFEREFPLRLGLARRGPPSRERSSYCGDNKRFYLNPGILLLCRIPQSIKNLNKSRPALYKNQNDGMSQSDRAGWNPFGKGGVL